MKSRHVLIALFCGLITYFALSFFQGPHSPRRLQELELYNQALETNLEALVGISADLEARYYQLRDDSSAIEREANRIGMVYPDQMMFQLDERQRSVGSISPGQMLDMNPAAQADPMLLRATALSVSLIVLVLMVILDPPKNPETGRPARKESDSRSDGPVMTAYGRVGSDVEMAQSMRVQVASRE